MRLLIATALLCFACANHYPKSETHCDRDRGNGYIPADLMDAIHHLACTLAPDVLDEMHKSREDEMVRWHWGLGTRIRNHWLQSDSPLLREMVDRGLIHKDDMSGVILISLWRHLHGKPLRIDDQVRHYQEFWAYQEALPNMKCPDGSEPKKSTQAFSGERNSSGLRPFKRGSAFCEGVGWYRIEGLNGHWEFVGDNEPNLRE